MPEALICPLLTKLPPVMLAVALIKPPVNKLPPAMLAVLVIVDVALINPPVNTLPPVTLAVALTNPAVNTLPPVMLPAALTIVPALINELTARLVPFATPMFGVVRLALVLTLILPEPSNAVVTPSTLALNTDPIKLKPADVLAV